MRVTLDTNVFGPVADIASYPDSPDVASCVALREAVESGRVSAYVSQTSLGLEALNHKQRIDEFFREWATKLSHITLPTPAAKRLQIADAVFSLGVKVLKVPRVALGSLVQVPDSSWAESAIYPEGERQRRFDSLIGSFPEKGPAPLKQLGVLLARLHRYDTSCIPCFPGSPPPEELIWIEGIVAEFDAPRRFKNRKAFVREVREIVAEWYDLDMIASHYAYGNDYVCTFDEARGTGSDGILHCDVRLQLRADFGISCLSPRELMDLVSRE